MSLNVQNTNTSALNNRPFLTWQLIIDWAEEHYRSRAFSKDERIPARPGLLYLIQKGAIRLVGNANISANRNVSNNNLSKSKTSPNSDEPFLGLVGAGQPFELIAQSPFTLQAYAHIDKTTVLWMYWHELDNWPHFRREVLDAFRYQHQRKLLWLSTLGQRRTIDRLFGFLTLLIEEYGQPWTSQDNLEVTSGYYLPWPLTHTQIGSAIGSTRVTVTRLIGKLRQQGLVYIQNDNLICLPMESQNQ
ncbi:MAG: Crp/Fnr family transcriptional regulator [Trichodesmium sp. ALOHA_ZT_67]|nr:Crp/Fnr family transcriptional regulator [Trichodesmium erythraeum GBRTRLIN201]MCH2051026.1 Crp/Fnr family transcriptional regulator [Trichodesmium sp. ALOHA_ZT_67]MDE5096105.1 Crp/Fnr family transcriptional regulator [Trichodesmium sp. St11_bin5]MDT9340592.1 Crp/Fnr family transcriptional regulator [Trichodesmium erythraeum 21-75]